MRAFFVSGGCDNVDVAEPAQQHEYDPEAEAKAVAAARAERDRALTPEQRLERLHRLCAELAGIARRAR